MGVSDRDLVLMMIVSLAIGMIVCPELLTGGFRTWN